MATMGKLATVMQTHMRLKRNIMISPLNLYTRALFSTTRQRKSTTTSSNFAKQKDSSSVDEPVLSSPCLILPQNEAINQTYQVRTFLGRCFYDLGKKRFLPAPEEQHSGMIKSEEGKMVLSADARCVGSSHGWLAFFNHSNRSIYLMNPFTLQTIPLPPIDTLFLLFVDRYTTKSYDASNFNKTGSASSKRLQLRYKNDYEMLRHSTGRYLDNIVLSSPPDVADCKVFIYCDGDGEVSVAFCRVGDKKWTQLDGDTDGAMIYSNKNKKFYGTLNHIFYKRYYNYKRVTADIFEWDVDSGTESTILEASISYPEFNDFEFDLRKKCRTFTYLVESSGEILLVVRYRADHVVDGDVVLSCEEDPCCEFPNKTIRFDVFKLDPIKQKLNFVKNLGDKALFVGISHSFSLSASEFPEIKSNSIYFTDHPSYQEHFNENSMEHNGESYAYGGDDFGIFNLEDNTISPFYHSETKKFSPLPFWLEPPQLSVRF